VGFVLLQGYLSNPAEELQAALRTFEKR
jgi:hypothetical protein